jgi:integrase/recombinase XerD
MGRGRTTKYPGIARLNEEEMMVRVRIQGPTGQRKEVERRVRTQSVHEALKYQEQLREEMLAQMASETGLAHVRGGPDLTETLSGYAKRWVQHLQNTGRCRPHVLSQRVDVLERFVLPSLGQLRMVEIRPAHLAAWMEWLGNRTMADGAHYRAHTLNSAWAVCRSLLRDAVVLAGLRQDPTTGVRFHAKGAPAKQKDILTQEEVHALLGAAALESPDVRAMLVLGFTTGMRFGEMSALTWADVDFERRNILVAKSQVKGHVGQTKTGTVRRVPLADATVAVLMAHREWQKTQLVPNLDTTRLLFPSKKGTHRSPSMLFKPLLRCANRAGITKHVSPHTMRRTVNNLIRQASGDIVARAVTGHATSEMTEHYSHVSTGEKLNAQTAALGDLAKVLSDRWSRWGDEMGGRAKNGGKNGQPE